MKLVNMVSWRQGVQAFGDAWSAETVPKVDTSALTLKLTWTP